MPELVNNIFNRYISSHNFRAAHFLPVRLYRVRQLVGISCLSCGRSRQETVQNTCEWQWLLTSSTLLLLACAKSHMLSASRRQPHLLHVSAVDRRQTWSMDKS